MNKAAEDEIQYIVNKYTPVERGEDRTSFYVGAATLAVFGAAVAGAGSQNVTGALGGAAAGVLASLSLPFMAKTSAAVITNTAGQTMTCRRGVGQALGNMESRLQKAFAAAMGRESREKDAVFVQAAQDIARDAGILVPAVHIRFPGGNGFGAEKPVLIAAKIVHAPGVVEYVTLERAISTLQKPLSAPLIPVR